MLSHADAGLAARDVALACGLRLLLDEAAVSRTLQAQLPEIELRNVRASYVRYKPGTNCLVAYKLSFDGEDRDVYAKAYAAADREKLRVANSALTGGKWMPQGTWVLEGCNVAVSFFPSDRKLKSLARVVDQLSSRRLARKLLPHRADLWNSRVKTLRYKPERRFVGRIDSEDGKPRALLKVYGDDSFDSALTNSLAFKSRARVRIAHMLGVHERHRAIAFEWINGQTLDEIISNGGSAAAISATGEALAKLHGQSPVGLRRRTRTMEARALFEVARGISYLAASHTAIATSLAKDINHVLGESDRAVRPVHGDFYASQVLIADDEAAILDLDEAAWGDPLSDLGNFLAHVQREHVRGRVSAPRVQEIEAALLEGYCRTSARSIQPRLLATHTAASLLKLTHDPFRQREQNWTGTTALLIERARDTFDLGRKMRTSLRSASSMSDPFHAAEDPAMPFLRRALDPSEALKQLRDTLKNQYGLTGHIDLQAIRVTRYKPARRCLVEYDVVAGHAGREEKFLTLVGKARSRGVDERCFRMMQSLRASGFNEQSRDGIAVPEPVGVIPEFNMWLQRKVLGASCAAQLTGPAGVDLARRIAGAVVKLQRAAITPERRHTIADELEVLQQRLSLVAVQKPHWRARLSRVMTACLKLASSLPPTTPVPAHRDFYADQIVVAGERLYLVDFDLCTLADPALDAGNFMAHIREQRLRETENKLQLGDVERELEDRFVALSDPGSRTAVRAYATLSLVRHIYISGLFNDRRRFTESILELCERSFEVSRCAEQSELRLSFGSKGVNHATSNS